MNVRMLVLAALVAAIFGSSSPAGIVLTTPPVTSVFSAPDSALTGFTSYQIDVAIDNGDLISAVDVIFGGVFHQRWVDTDFSGLTDATRNGPPANGRGYSHLTLPSGSLVAVAPTEDNAIGTSPLPVYPSFDYGMGTKLDGAWGIPGPKQSTSATLAYLVMPDDRVSELSYNIPVATRSGDNHQVFNLARGNPPVRPPRPEPKPTPQPPTSNPPTPPAAPPKPSAVAATSKLVTTTFGAPEESLEGYVGYQLAIEAPEGLRITVIDLSIKDPLHQRWSDIDFDGAIDQSVVGPAADGRGDSHVTPPYDALLLPRDDVVQDDNNIEPSPLADGEFDYGTGSLIRGV